MGKLSTLRVSRGDVRPIGFVEALSQATVPVGWLLCDGSAVSRSLYVRLFTVIGTTYGVGDGSTTFTLPDLRGEFIRAHDPSGSLDGPARSVGSTQSEQRGSHTHGSGTLASGSANVPHSHGPVTTPTGTAPHSHRMTMTHNNGAPTHPSGRADVANFLGPFGTTAPNTSPFSQGVNTDSASMPHTHPSGTAPAVGIAHSHSTGGNTEYAGGPSPDSEIRPDNVAVNYVIRY